MEEQENGAPKVLYLGVSGLLFDLQNPRFKGLTNQQEALSAFCTGNYTRKTVKIAEHIAANGVNPSELLMVIGGDHRRQHLVLEGNRRLAALKLLAMPARLNELPLSSAYKNKLRRAAAMVDRGVLERVPCVRLGSREDANLWIALKHTGENEGVGVVQWDGEESARFRGRDPGYRLLDFVRQHATLSPQAKEGLKKFPVTNLERLLGDPTVRAALGIDLDGGDIRITHRQDDVLKGLTRVVEDLATKKVTVTALKRKADRADYLRRIGGDLPKGQPLDDPRDLDGTKITSKGGAGAAPTAKRGRPKSIKSRLVRDTLISKSCTLPINVSRIQDIFLELRSLAPLESFPNAGAALLRIFIDTSTNEYARKFGVAARENNAGQTELKPRLEAVLKHLTENGGDREACASAKNALLQPQGHIPVDRLHLLLHGRYEMVSAEQLRLGWEQIEPFITELWKALDGLASSNGPQ